MRDRYSMNFVMDDGAFAPVRGHDADAGLDLRTPIDCIVPARGSVVIDTGIHFDIPYGAYGKLESKSGLNMKGIVSLGGVIDSGYTGSVVAKLYNMTDEDYEFRAGDKVVQIIFTNCYNPEMVLVSELPDRDRGDNGFGSTGR